ncbi:MAG TPA: diadenosine tetraphosphatase [Gammaproteobacteria bacterium]|nr:diadenosine tetraphosphatase [Gammaproteobacteria bacterium]
MASYAIGDVQGCLDPLLRLLDRIGFDATRDRLLFTGDLVNRGPQSLATLRFVRDLGTAAVTVLGNHDLHLLVLALTANGRRLPDDTLGEILEAPDREPLLDWLRSRPLAFADEATGFLLVHAGVHRDWDTPRTLALASEVAAVLGGPRETAQALLADLYGNEPAQWQEALRGQERLRCIVNVLTRMRFCHADGGLDFRCKRAPGQQPEGLLPWYALPGRLSRDTPVVFGHWSTLHLGDDDPLAHGVWGIDSGCLWGGRLTALRLEDRVTLSVPGLPRRPPRAGEPDPRP